MKALLVIGLFFISLSVFSQEPIERNVGDFKELKVFDLIYVSLVPAEEDKVIITGLGADDISIVNHDGILKIKMKTSQSFRGSENKVVVYFKDLAIIDANEGAIISSKVAFERSEVTLKAQEGGKIVLTLNVTELTSKAVTGGILELQGTAKVQNIDINTGGVSNGKDLITETTDIKIKAGGEADINASQLVDINIKAGGDVFVYGNPKEISQKKLFGGRVKVIKEAP